MALRLGNLSASIAGASDSRNEVANVFSSVRGVFFGRLLGSGVFDLRLSRAGDESCWFDREGLGMLMDVAGLNTGSVMMESVILRLGGLEAFDEGRFDGLEG
jgi:hypothetical protein